MIRILVPLITLGLFCALAAYSYGKVVSPERHPPIRHQSLGEFINQKQTEYDAIVAYRTRERNVLVWSDEKVAMIAEALSLTPDSVDATIDVRREP